MFVWEHRNDSSNGGNCGLARQLCGLLPGKPLEDVPQQKSVPPECPRVTRVNGSFPTGPFKRLPTESYKGSPTVKLLTQESGSVSEVRINRSSGVADIDKKVIESVS